MQEERTMIRYEKGCSRTVSDALVNEYALEIEINDHSFARLLCSPKELEYLCLGYLYGESKISSMADVIALDIDAESGKACIKLNTIETDADRPAYLTTGLGPQKSITATQLPDKQIPIAGGLRLDAEKISALVEEFQQGSSLFIETGGVHSCALSDGEKIIVSFDDIGRHNALDKVVGFALKNRLNLNKHLLITSGRIPAYMAYKCYHADLPFIVSRSAVTAAAVDFAQKTGMTLIGFARNARFNIYSGAERVLNKNL